MSGLDRRSFVGWFSGTTVVEYIQANRVRTLVMQAVHEAMKDVDVVVTPSQGGNIIQLTNLTGHPCVVLPNGFTTENVPVSLSFIGGRGLYKEAETLRVAKAYQDATGFHFCGIRTSSRRET